MRKFALILMVVSSQVFSQGNNSFCDKLSEVALLIQKEHFRPKPIDDSLSVFVFDTFFDQIDKNRNTFTKTEYDLLSKYRLKIDDAVKKNDCSFFNEFATFYGNALKRKQSLLMKIQNIPVDYALKDTLRFSRDRFPFDMEENDQERILKKRIKVDILEEISKMSENKDSLKSNFASIEKIVKPKAFETALCKIATILEDKNGFKNQMQTDFLNIFCSYFDPHSNYFTLDGKSTFMSMLTTSNLSVGLNFSLNEKEELVVDEVIPGGPAARTELFEKDDVLIKVENNIGASYTVSCSSLDAIGDMIYSDSNREIKLTIRKKNGTLHEVSLKKQIMDATENHVFSFLAEKDIRVGYIKIPGFYSDFSGNDHKGCADDVAKEIVKLETDNIQGLVIDLQDNGGGSMDEGQRLAGMFIDRGPVALLSDSRGKHSILKDNNSGMAYNGPIVILINGQSASASEFFASAMQDYKRAVVIGSTSAGKATMQSILPLDDKNDFVKLTLQKFYRITGESCQEIGVTPDVEMPVIFDSVVPREKSMKNALKNDRILTKVRFNEYLENDLSGVFFKSRERVKSNTTFATIAELNRRVNSWYNKKKLPVPLSLDKFFNDVHENDLLWKEIKAVAMKPANCTVSNTDYKTKKLEFEPFQKEINAYKMKEVQANPYLEEAINIIADMNRNNSMKK